MDAPIRDLSPRRDLPDLDDECPLYCSPTARSDIIQPMCCLSRYCRDFHTRVNTCPYCRSPQAEPTINFFPADLFSIDVHVNDQPFIHDVLADLGYTLSGHHKKHYGRIIKPDEISLAETLP